MAIGPPVKGGPCRPASPLTIALLGPPYLALPNQQLSIQGSKAEALLVQLAIFHRAPVARSFLLEQLWPTDEPTLAGQALSSLSSELNKFSRKVGNRVNILVSEHGYHGFNLEVGVSTDIEQFDRLRTRGLALLAQGDAQTGIHACQQALALYRSDLCGDENIHTVIERERLRTAMLDLLSALADQACQSGDLPEALVYLQRLLLHEPYREDIHRQLMVCYAQMGLRTRALHQYRVCERILATEFGMVPEAITTHLYEQIRSGATVTDAAVNCPVGTR
ncbi:MAG: bacterial transcriptional activator domain-containing protein [Caldilineaceae bacterium]